MGALIPCSPFWRIFYAHQISSPPSSQSAAGGRGLALRGSLAPGRSLGESVGWWGGGVGVGQAARGGWPEGARKRGKGEQRSWDLGAEPRPEGTLGDVGKGCQLKWTILGKRRRRYSDASDDQAHTLTGYLFQQWKWTRGLL